MTTTLKGIAQAAEKAVRASQDRDWIIREAHKNGYTMRAIAEAAALSPARIHQIISAGRVNAH